MSVGDYLAGGRAVKSIPRTTAADSTAKVVEALARRTGPPASFWGMLMVVASEGVLFGAMIGTFFYLRFNTAVWPPHGDPAPKVVVPLILVACLSTTSGFMQLAWRAVRAGRLAATRLAIVAALVVQCGYFAYEVQDFADEIHKDPISTDAYSSIHFTLLGADHAHVFVGILLDLWLLLKLARGLTTYRANAVQAITWYTHFVNVLTWVVIGTLLSAAA
jgi:heme/copper-type cytochrome/quinol oxidase subunit 3